MADVRHARKKTRRKPAGRGALNRTVILDAALEIINDQGLEALSMRRIVKKLGCSVAGPYTHFKSQDDILSSLIERGERDLTGDLKRAKDAGGEIFDMLKRIAVTYRDFARNNRELHKLMFHIPGSEKVFRSATASYRVYLDALRQGVKSGRLKFTKKGYHAMARTMWAWLYGLIVLEMTGVTEQGQNFAFDDGFAVFQRLLEQGE